MNRPEQWGSYRLILALTGAAFLATACAHVKPEEMESELAQLRGELQEEMRQGDQAVEQRLGQQLSELESRLISLETDLDQLRTEFDVTVERLETAIRFNAPVHFAFDDAAVRATDRELLDRFAEVVRGQYDGATITVEGFTDPSGSPQYNMQLGQRRAEAVRDYLVGQGLAEGSLRAVSYGEAQERQVVPGAQGPGQDGWQNRRVAMVIDFRPDTGSPTVAMGTDGDTH